MLLTTAAARGSPRRDEGMKVGEWIREWASSRERAMLALYSQLRAVPGCPEDAIQEIIVIAASDEACALRRANPALPSPRGSSAYATS